jgi:N-acyl-L-homoserine lactone synthetase
MSDSSQASSRICVRYPQSPGEREEAYRLRYRVYVEELGFPQQHADHQRRAVEDQFDASAVLLIAIFGDAVVGTVRSNYGSESAFGPFAALHRMHELGPLYPSKVSLTSKLIVDRGHRTGKVALALARSIFRIGVTLGIAVDFIDCQPTLVRFYRRLGYEQTRETPFEHPELGPRIPMRLWFDQDHLARAGSLLLREPS